MVDDIYDEKMLWYVTNEFPLKLKINLKMKQTGTIRQN